jgi:hypothetical protein
MDKYAPKLEKYTSIHWSSNINITFPKDHLKLVPQMRSTLCCYPSGGSLKICLPTSFEEGIYALVLMQIYEIVKSI